MASAVLALASGSAAHAAPILTISGDSGVFGDDMVTGSFERVFRFDGMDGFQIASLDISSIAAGQATALDFTSVTFNGVEFETILTGAQEFRNLMNQPLLASNVIVVKGMAGDDAAFSGTLSFAPIPEPSVWAAMIAGFGLVGAAMRRRTRVAYA